MDNLQTSSLDSSGAKRNFYGTYEAMIKDSEKEKKLNLEKEPHEQGAIFASQLGLADAVKQPRWVQ